MTASDSGPVGQPGQTVCETCGQPCVYTHPSYVVPGEVAPPAQGHQAHATLIAELVDNIIAQRGACSHWWLVSKAKAIAALASQSKPGQRIAELIAEMRSVALVAGQYSVETPRGPLSFMSAIQADRATRCADMLAALASGGAHPPLDWKQFAQDLPPDAAKILRDNLWDLYEGGTHPQEQEPK